MGKSASSYRRISRLAAAAVVGLLGAAALGVLQFPSMAAEEAVKIPAPSIDQQPGGGPEKAIFAGGCFWGVQGVFQHVEGVTSAVSGYAGGEQSTAVYQTVGTGRTGHAEAVEVTYDPAKVSYGKLLQVFFSVAHNPTQLNYQGPDHGTQYRSAIFPLDADQENVAAA
jgi:peptide-methionine (S)-S-oxide reductase